MPSQLAVYPTADDFRDLTHDERGWRRDVVVETGLRIYGDHDCEWCGEIGARPTVRVVGTGDTDPSVTVPIEVIDVCRTCAPEVIDQAERERSDTCRDLVLVQVAG